MLTIGTDTDKIRTVFYALNDYVRKGVAKSRNRAFVVHRLDRDTSGLLVFAKSEKAKRTLQKQWETSRKTYLAVVHGTPADRDKVITSYLAESKTFNVYSIRDETKGKLARTSYRLVKQSRKFALLEIDLLTGRKHQIRVHLAEAGHPIVGDRRYGKDKKKFKRMALHAQYLSFKHPHSGNELSFSGNVPSFISDLVGGYEWECPQP